MTPTHFTSCFCAPRSFTRRPVVVSTSSASVTPWISQFPQRLVLPSSAPLGLCVPTKTFLASRLVSCYPFDTSICLLLLPSICSTPWLSSATCPNWASSPVRLAQWSRFFPTTLSRSSSVTSLVIHTASTRSGRLRLSRSTPRDTRSERRSKSPNPEVPFESWRGLLAFGEDFPCHDLKARLG